MRLLPSSVFRWAGDTDKGGEAPNPAYSVVRGPLLYSLPIEHNYTVYGRHFDVPHGDPDADASNDYYLSPTSHWNYALAADPADPAASLTFAAGTPYVDGAAPFNRTGPLAINARVRQLPSWGMEKNSAAPPPKSPACTGEDDSGSSSSNSVGGGGSSSSSSSSGCGAVQTVQLVPHGYTELRIGEFPLA